MDGSNVSSPYTSMTEETNMSIFYRIIIVLLWLVWLSSCKSTEKSSVSQTGMRIISNTQLETIDSQFSTFNSLFSFEENGYIVVKETQTITEYDTTQPGNPIAKETKTEKESRKGTQVTTEEQKSQERRNESQSTSSEEDNSQFSTFDAQLEKKVPVVQTTTRWYVIGGIIIAAITLVTSVITRRAQKKRARKAA